MLRDNCKKLQTFLNDFLVWVLIEDCLLRSFDCDFKIGVFILFGDFTNHTHSTRALTSTCTVIATLIFKQTKSCLAYVCVCDCVSVRAVHASLRICWIRSKNHNDKPIQVLRPKLEWPYKVKIMRSINRILKEKKRKNWNNVNPYLKFHLNKKKKHEEKTINLDRNTFFCVCVWPSISNRPSPIESKIILDANWMCGLSDGRWVEPCWGVPTSTKTFV